MILIFLTQVLSVVFFPRSIQQIKKDSSIGNQKIDLYLIQIFSILIIISAPYSDGHFSNSLIYAESLRYFGLILIPSGFFLMRAAEKSLDKQFSIEVTLQKDHKLITNGPYRIIRHPRYSGIIVFFLGIALVFYSLMAISLLTGLSIILIWRVSIEDDLMKQEFGQEWHEYSLKTRKLIPFLF